MQVETLQNGRYRLLHSIGQGGMGEVYLAEDTRVDRQIAIKVIRTGVLPSSGVMVPEDAVRLFQREAKAVAQLDHPNILPLFDYGEEVMTSSRVTYMVMPFCPEGSFVDWLRERSTLGLLSLTEAIHFVHQAASALQHAHEHQIIHRDVKPSNFLLRSNTEKRESPDLLLTDFGIAMSNTDVTSQIIRGTPTYMAPEQWSGVAVPATDQYALAIIAYELLTGRIPFQGTQEQAMYRHLITLPQPPSTLNPHLSPGVDAVLLRALAKQSTDRFASVSDFAHALQQALQSTHTSTRYEDDIDGPTVSPAVVAHPESAALVTYKAVQAPSPLSSSIPHVSNSLQNQRDDEHIIHHQDPRNSPRRRRGMLLMALALLVIAVSIGLPLLFAYQRNGHLTALHATATAQANLTATAVASRYPFSNTILLDNPLRGNNGRYNWMETSTNTTGGSCAFMGSAYHVSETQSGYFNTCFAQHLQFTNFTYEVEMNISNGDAGGIVFRADSTYTKFYYLRFDQNGVFSLRLYVDATGATSRLLKSGFSPAIAFSPNETNTIAVVARNETIDLYLNQQFLTSVTDSTYNQGQIGVTADDATTPTDVIFTHAKVWKLP